MNEKKWLRIKYKGHEKKMCSKEGRINEKINEGEGGENKEGQKRTWKN